MAYDEILLFSDIHQVKNKYLAKILSWLMIFATNCLVSNWVCDKLYFTTNSICNKLCLWQTAFATNPIFDTLYVRQIILQPDSHCLFVVWEQESSADPTIWSSEAFSLRSAFVWFVVYKHPVLPRCLEILLWVSFQLSQALW